LRVGKSKEYKRGEDVAKIDDDDKKKAATTTTTKSSPMVM
jgi:hypothetical protein